MSSPDDRHSLHLSALRRKLADRRGRPLWRSLEEIAETAEFRRYLEAEYPSVAALVLPETSRRSLLKAMAASLMLGGLAGCGDTPVREAVPYVNQPEHVIPGRPRYYATAVLFEGFAQPVLAETHVGRPTKLEGNPDHPLIRGGTDPFMQAAVLQFYDPDRSQAVTAYGRVSSWLAFDRAMDQVRARLDATRGAGLRVLTGQVTSPTLIRQFGLLQQRWPDLRRHVFEPVGTARRTEATQRAFGRPLDPYDRLDRAAVIVSLEDDLLGPGPHQVPYGRDWSDRRRATRTGADITRLYVAESTPTLTGAMAASRRVTPSARIPVLAAALAQRLGIAGVPPVPELTPPEEAWIGMAADALRRHGGQSLLAVGAQQPAEVQALGFQVNQALGNTGNTIVYTDPVALPVAEDQSLAVLAADMEAGRVETLIMLDVNPVYTAPADLDFTRRLERVKLRIHAGMFYDETASHSHWHVPLSHPLESWSDARAVDGTLTILQPTAAPLYQSRSVHEVLAVLLGAPVIGGQDIVRETWREAGIFTGPGADFETGWTRALQAGFVAGTAFPPQTVAPQAVALTLPPAAVPADNTVELVFRPDPSVWDGRFANCAWLQELPKPLTKLTWDTIAAVSPALAERLDLTTGDVAELTAGDRRIAAPVWVLPGQAERTVTVFLGYGRWRAGRVGDGAGYNAYALRASDAPWTVQGARLVRTGDRHDLVSTQPHQTMEGYDLVHVVSPAEAAAPLRPTPNLPGQPSLYDPWPYPNEAWAMAIDIDTCIGCNACVVACQAENNVPVVGKDQTAMGRNMHWLRIDTYYAGDPADPAVYFMPVPCMHCEKAPCEVGCPVNATVHGPDGINEMVYNRCVGTRTCSSYCPYKVRRFNWFEYSASEEPGIHAQWNPNVTVRSRGVMEKCTYCIQRVAEARIEAGKEDRPIRDGEVLTACQQACPTQAIVFGDMNNPDSAVTRAKRDPNNYALLFNIGTRPRTTYLPRVQPEEPEREA